MSGVLTSEEGELNAIIKEYLELLKLDSTVQAFEEECRKKGKPIQVQAGKRDEKFMKVQKQLLQHFDKGKQLEFFKFWDTHMNFEVGEDHYMQKLEFMLHVHFAVYPLRKKDHWVQEDVEQSMYQFRTYIETRGAFLSTSPDLLPFFALPYVSDVSSHPTFVHIFQDSWVHDLRKKLETFCWEYSKVKLVENQGIPRLVDLFNNNDFDLNEAKAELKVLQRRLNDSEKCYINESKKADRLKEDCKQLMTTASLLVNALESAVKGDFIDLDCVLSSCTEHFPEVYRLKTTENGIIQRPTSVKPWADNCSNLSEAKPNITNRQEPPLEFNINFTKIKEHLCTGTERNQLLLLQALRWRLTKASEWSQKEKAISMYIDNDILGLKTFTVQQPSFVHVMRSFSVPIRQGISRLLNSFASLSKGREYLSQCPELLQALMDNLLVYKSKDSIIRDMTLGTLQKLSMRSVCQELMVEAGMMEWLINTLSIPRWFSEYGLEYSVALLMNLCLCPIGKSRCDGMKEKLIPLLRNLMMLADNSSIIGYVNGALYSVLSIPSVKKFALEENMMDTLHIAYKSAYPEIQKQLSCIMDLLTKERTETASTNSSSSDEEPDEEEAELEPELEADDPIVIKPGEYSGEHLLWKEYSLTSLTLISEFQQRDKKMKHEQRFKQDRSASEITPNRNVKNENVDNIGPDDIIQVSPAVLPTSAPELLSFPLQQLSPSRMFPASEPVTPKLDLEATQLVRKIVGQASTMLVEASTTVDPASIKVKGLNANEYKVAFSSRPKIPRTPELSASGSSKRSSAQCPPSPDDDSFLEIAPKVSASSPVPSPRHVNKNKKYLQKA